MYSILANIIFYFMQLANKLLIYCLTITNFTLAQKATSTLDRMASYEKLKAPLSDLSSIPFTNIGPSVMSGRVTDLSVNPNNPNEFYVAYASGSLWHTTNNGQSFKPLFDQEATHTIGAIAVNWKENIIWIGTGEANSSRSSYAGTGMYKSIDSGKTWQHKGLNESHHIGKIIIDDNKKDLAYVAVLGHLYTPNEERGFYKTIDGGDSWQHTLKVNDTTGCIDICINPLDKNIVYTTTWSRTRSAWQFTGQGEGSAIYKSSDAGESWKLMSGDNSGFPKNKNIGRIGISLCATIPNVLYALVDNQNNQIAKPKKPNEPIKALDIKKMSEAQFMAIKNSVLKQYLKENDYPEKYTATNVKEDIKNKKYTVNDVADWVLSDADAAMFQTPVIGAELYRSTDAGTTWKKTHENNIEGLFFTYGYYFATVEAHPTQDTIAYLLGYTAIKTGDAGKTFKEIAKENCHADYHRLWVNYKNPKHMIIGNDGGINITYDEGDKWYKANNPAVGQFYTITTDNKKPYNVYGGLQDNGTWVGPSTYKDKDDWHQNGAYAYKEIGGGDGMQVQVDSRDNQTIYSGYQFGFYQRSHLTDNTNQHNIHPTHNIGEKPLRFNWQTPIHLSRHNQDVLYMGANYFYRSLLKGENLKKLGNELTTTKNSGNVPYGTITTISESPLRFGLLYTGTDDGNIHVSKDIGNTWDKINSPNLPKDLWTSRIIASQYFESNAYVTFNGYRNDNFKPYIFSTNNYGKTWKDISANLPDEPINVVHEDPKDTSIIYVGTDNGLYVSFNNGSSYEAFHGNLPRVAIHDIAIQADANEIVLGTHGRSIYKVKLKDIQALSKNRKENFVLMPIDKKTFNKNWGSTWASYAEAEKPEIEISFYTKDTSDYSIEIRDVNDQRDITLKTIKGKAKYGYNYYTYDAQTVVSKKMHEGANNKYYLRPGKYKVTLKQSAKTQSAILEITEKIEKEE